MKRFYTRSDWAARRPRVTLDVQPSPREVFIHHTENDDAGIVDTLAEQKTRVRGIQSFHMDGRGWNDIAYHAIIFQPTRNIPIARVFFGRYPDQIPAAQLNHNTNTLAIAVYGDFRTDTVQRNTRYAIEETIRKLAPRAVTLGGHRDVVATTCPGPKLYKELDRIADAVNLKRFK